ncbi:hypothetical protein COB57_01595 [Candidatus Peregrinibacteria bacterium]|nr:MAG: hypothetical protein COB57_01595 [Candidatus Peregrinibacteria bacterium]
MSKAERVLLVTLFLSFVLTFFSWFYSTETSDNVIVDTDSYESTIYYNAYQGITSVLGYLYVLFLAIPFVGILISMKDKWVKSFFEKRPWLFLFFTGESLFLLIITFLVYSAYAIQAFKSGIQPALIITIIVNLVSLFAAHFYYIRKDKERRVRLVDSQLKSQVQLETDIVGGKIPDLDKKEEESDAQMTLGDYY